MTISFDGFDKHQVILELWKNTKYMGLGFHNSKPEISNSDILNEIERLLNSNQYIDYLLGKPIKTNFSNYPYLDSRLYDRDAGSGTMLKVKQLFSNNITDYNINHQKNSLNQQDNSSNTKEDLEAIEYLLGIAQK